VAAAGGGEVSNSWGGSDGSGEQALDSFFVNSKVVFLASTGDHNNNTDPPWSADVEYPSTSPNVVGVGGTRVVRNSNHTFNSENPWDNSSGGGGGAEHGRADTGFPKRRRKQQAPRSSRRSRHCR
jgi:kumamolisin